MKRYTFALVALATLVSGDAPSRGLGSAQLLFTVGRSDSTPQRSRRGC